MKYLERIRKMVLDQTQQESVDVVYMNNASEGILQEIQKDGIKWK